MKGIETEEYGDEYYDEEVDVKEENKDTIKVVKKDLKVLEKEESK